MLLWGYEKEGTNYSNLFGDFFASIELKLEKIGSDFSTKRKLKKNRLSSLV